MLTRAALIFSTVLLLSGCGAGPTYFSVDWAVSPISYWDDNPSLPYSFYRGTYYETNVGTYFFEYTAWDGSSWYGTYNIKADKGIFGGDPAYFELNLYSSGPSFYQWSTARSAVNNIEPTGASPFAECKLENIEQVQVCRETKITDGYTIELEYYKSSIYSPNKNKI